VLSRFSKVRVCGAVSLHNPLVLGVCPRIRKNNVAGLVNDLIAIGWVEIRVRNLHGGIHIDQLTKPMRSGPPSRPLVRV